jgi:tetrapyrrole methylase family protein/MazG family protein
MPKAPQNLDAFASLLKVVEHLRGPQGCPWDKEQTHQTLTRYALEEAFELSEAIDSGDPSKICDELGDVLLQVVLNAEIARQAGTFTIADVIRNLNEKMVRRHPHVFADQKVETSQEVLRNWAAIKAQEKGKSSNSFDIPAGLPALLRSQKIGEKTKKYGFDWQDADHCWPKIKEELIELEGAIKNQSRNEIESELGDVLFSVVQLARHLELDAEQALRQTNQRFTQRFERMRELVQAAGQDWATLSAAEKERYWKQAKKNQ